MSSPRSRRKRGGETKTVPVRQRNCGPQHMSLPTQLSTHAQSADVVFESRKGRMRRVAMYAMEFGPPVGNVAQKLEKEGRVGVKHHHVRQKHFYTGEVVPADSTHNCGNSSNDFIPHGVGTLVFFLYAKPNAVGSAEKPTASVGLPHEIVLGEYGEVEELRGAVLFAFIVYKGLFNYGKRQGKGELTAYPHYSIDCLWENDIPLLDDKVCVLRYLNKSHMSSDAETKLVNSPVATKVASANSIAESVTCQYIGMTSLILPGETSHHTPFAGLVWANQARFVPDGVGEMLYLQGIRYCGSWKCGQRHGFGVEYDPCTHTLYKGGFACDHREGSGTLHYCHTGVLLRGTWKEGEPTETTDAFLPTSPIVLQNAVWKSRENWSLDHGTLVCSPVVLSGVWEPLFVEFDAMLTSLPWPCQDSLPFTASKTMSADENECDLVDFHFVVTSMMQRPEFMALLVLFQRCFYFLYKACVGGKKQKKKTKQRWRQQEKVKTKTFSSEGGAAEVGPVFQPPFVTGDSLSSDGGFPLRPMSQSDGAGQRERPHRLLETTRNTNSSKNLPSIVSELRELGRDKRCRAVGGPPKSCCWSSPSWCEEMGCGSEEEEEEDNSNTSKGVSCFHTATVTESLATQMSPRKLFECALHDLASFVASVRLRVLSHVAAHPTACNVAMSKMLFLVCWDAVFALAAPVIHDLAAAAEAEAVVATSLAFQRCSFLTREDFIPPELMADLCTCEEEQEAVRRLAKVFTSPVYHRRRVVKQTTNGQLLLFAPRVGSESAIPVVYASPASMLAAFESVHSCALRLFPQNPLLQERYMSYMFVAAFSHAADVNPRNTFSPLAVLRLLQFLACEVNPRYPFPSRRRNRKQHADNKDAQETKCHLLCENGSLGSLVCMEDKTEDAEWMLNFFFTSYLSSTREAELMPLFFSICESIERLNSIYPAIRRSLPSFCMTNASIGDNSATRVVYPLDELAVRARFVLFFALTSTNAAVGDLIQRCLKEQGDGNGVEWGSDGGDVMSTKNKDAGSTSEKVHLCAQRLLCLTVPAMQHVLTHQAGQRGDEMSQTERRDSLGGFAEQRQDDGGTAADAPLSQLLLWVVECVEEMLESSNYPTGAMSPNTTPKKCQPQLQQRPDAGANTSVAEKVLRVASADLSDPAEITLKGPSRECSAAGQETGDGDKVRCVCYRWKNFFPGNTTMDSSSDASVLTAAMMPEPLTKLESLQVSLLQHFLADVGVSMNFHLRFSYDNEEDVLPFRVEEDAVSSTHFEPYSPVNPGLAEENTTTTAPACCVGKEASLSLQVNLSFLGSRTWETLADAWLAACMTFRATGLGFQHTRRKCARANVVEGF